MPRVVTTTGGGPGLPAVVLSRAQATLVRALHRRRHRAEQRMYVAEGRRLLTELAGRAHLLEFVFGLPEDVPWLMGIFDAARVRVLAEDQGDLFVTESPQGVGAVVRMPAGISLGELNPGLPLLYLDAVGDPGNMGSILRSADWFGLGGVLTGPGCVDIYNPKAVRSSMGAVFQVAHIQLSDPVHELGEMNRTCIAVHAGGLEVLGDSRLPQAGIYVIGSEAHGISGEVSGLCSRSVRIAGRPGAVESLNAAMAAAVVCYQLQVQGRGNAG